MSVDYKSALEMCSLMSRHDRSEHKSLKFAIKCTNNKTNKNMIPINLSTYPQMERNRELIKVKKHTQRHIKSQQYHIPRERSIHISTRMRGSLMKPGGRDQS